MNKNPKPSACWCSRSTAALLLTLSILAVADSYLLQKYREKNIILEYEKFILIERAEHAQEILRLQMNQCPVPSYRTDPEEAQDPEGNVVLPT